MIVAVLIYLLPKYRRRTFLCAAAPGTILSLLYLKSLILFGLFLPGSDVYGATNLVYMTAFSLPHEVLAEMVKKGAISPIVLHELEEDELVHVVPLPPKTGIPILDQRLKSTGAINMDSLWMAAVGRQLHRDGVALLRAHPEAALETIGGSLRLYFLPADAGFPFVSGPCANRELLAPLLKVFDLIVSGKDPSDDYALLSYFTIPILLCFGLWRSLRWLRRVIRRPRCSAHDLTIVFAFGNIAYLSAVVVFTVYMDQNRYRFEVFPLFVVLLAAPTGFAIHRYRAWRATRKQLETAL
jgi:hypothetical protein